VTYEERIEAAAKVLLGGVESDAISLVDIIEAFLAGDTLYVLDKSDESAQWVVTADGSVGELVPLQPKGDT
jgi:hypothetical protein